MVLFLGVLRCCCGGGPSEKLNQSLSADLRAREEKHFDANINRFLTLAALGDSRRAAASCERRAAAVPGNKKKSGSSPDPPGGGAPQRGRLGPLKLKQGAEDRQRRSEEGS